MTDDLCPHGQPGYNICNMCLQDHALKAAEKPLTADFVRSLPGGKLDDSTYTQIEDELDKACAPAQIGNRWLSLAERVKALGEMVRYVK